MCYHLPDAGTSLKPKQLFRRIVMHFHIHFIDAKYSPIDIIPDIKTVYILTKANIDKENKHNVLSSIHLSHYLLYSFF